MRQKLNENPVAQIAIIGVLAVVVGFFVLSKLGGGEESGSAPAPEVATAAPEVGIEGSVQAAATSSVQAPSTGKLPADVEAAYAAGKTIVLLIYRPGGIDDRLTSEAAEVVGGIAGAALFEVKADKIARYVAITGPLGINQAPALIVIRGKAMNSGGAAPATVTYGFQTAADIRQAIVDSKYKGPELTYAPR